MAGLGPFGGAYAGRRVLVTGHSGFKGSWLALWLCGLGARVLGISLDPPSEPHHLPLLGLDMDEQRVDLRDAAGLAAAVAGFQPEVVFHLAAQPLVRLSYAEPAATFATNVMGTVNLLEACRLVPGLKAIVNVTSDKCYDNREWVWGYRENDPMGGHDPYSCSKGCAELVSESYRRSFFQGGEGGSQALLASARAGNVIGGGDWGQDRLVPDVVRAVAAGRPVVVRQPRAQRPWQHVLEPLSGYLLLGRALMEGRREYAAGWNFGPAGGRPLSVGELVELMAVCWPAVRHEFMDQAPDLHEATYLRLDSSKAHALLGWRGVWDDAEAVRLTVEWYRAYHENGEAPSRRQLDAYVRRAGELGLDWAKS